MLPGRLMVACALVLATGALADGQPWPLTLTFLQEAAAAPGLAGQEVFTGALHPGLRLGTEYRYLHGPALELAQSLSLAGYLHPRLENGLLLATELLGRARPGLGFSLELALGLGYLQTFAAEGVFRPGPSGTPAPAADPGTPHGWLSLAAGAAWRLPASTGVPLEVLVRYQVGLELPGGLAPLLPHSFLEAGLRVALAPAAWSAEVAP